MADIGRLLSNGGRTAAAALAMMLACSGGSGAGDFDIPRFWTWGQVVSRDLNGDDLSDVAVVTTLIDGPPPHAGMVRVYLRKVAGGFEAPVDYPAGKDPWGLEVGDLDGDGRLDLIASIPASTPPQVDTPGNSGGLAILRQESDGSGRFLASVWVPTGGAAEAAGVQDLTGDGLADVAVADGVIMNSRLLLLEQSSGQPGTLLPPLPVPVGTGHGFSDLEVVDIDGDGRADLVLAGYDCVAVLHQQASGGFPAPTLLTAGLRVEGVAVADLDGDGRADIVAANAGNAPAGGTGGSTVTVFLQTQPGAFASASIPVPDGARRVAIADLNGDGFLDLAVISLVYQDPTRPSRISILLQSEAQRGTYTLHGVQDGTMSSSFLALADLDGDDRVDILLSEGPSVMWQTSPGVFSAPTGLR